jgi:glycogen synthase
MLRQAQFNALAASLGGENAHFAFSYDESLSHLIYAGCDIICVPSMFEPCGLTQVCSCTPVQRRCILSEEDVQMRTEPG